MHRIINYSFGGSQKSASLEIGVYVNVKEPEPTINVKISEQAINKALMIAMNYLTENMETDENESAE